MHFDIELDHRLVAAIRPTYDVGNYTGAIIAAVQLMSDVIRNKSGLDSDGQALAGVAFGGPNPIIKLSALRTESERDAQRGVEFLLRGIYTGIRNPRSHELVEDSADTANALITFINWLLQLIDGSKSPFDPDDIIERVLDEHFVPTEKYASLIAFEVPPRIRLDVLIRLVDKTTFAKARNSRVFIGASLPLLDEIERGQFWETVSSKLITSSADGEAMALVRLASDHWPKCSEIARLRTENRLLKSLQEGKVDSEGRVSKGWPGVRIREIEHAFSMNEDLLKILQSKLHSYDSEQRAYVHKYFMETFVRLEPTPSEATVRLITHRLKGQDSDTYHALGFLTAAPESDPWFVTFKDALEAFEFRDDDIPF
jgi:uncharacterized protein (TIGR02391 family)